MIRRHQVMDGFHRRGLGAVAGPPLEIPRRDLGQFLAFRHGEDLFDVLSSFASKLVEKLGNLVVMVDLRGFGHLLVPLRRLQLEDMQLARCAAHYLHHEGITSHEFKGRLFAHLRDPNFVDDVARFITDATHTFEPDVLVQKWIWWSDNFLDRAMINIDLNAGAPRARLQEWEERRRDDLVQCAMWVEESGNTRRCANRITPEHPCSEHQ